MKSFSIVLVCLVGLSAGKFVTQTNQDNIRSLAFLCKIFCSDTDSYSYDYSSEYDYDWRSADGKMSARIFCKICRKPDSSTTASPTVTPSVSSPSGTPSTDDPTGTPVTNSPSSEPPVSTSSVTEGSVSTSVPTPAPSTAPEMMQDAPTTGR